MQVAEIASKLTYAHIHTSSPKPASYGYTVQNIIILPQCNLLIQKDHYHAKLQEAIKASL